MKVPVEVSARHIHVSQQDLETLFGAGHELNYIRELSQPGQYLCQEKVEVIGEKGSLTMSILGPVRKATQIEIALTDARKIGVNALIRESGDIEGSAGALLKGPAGEVKIDKGVIIAKRHVHVSEEDGQRTGLKNKQIVKVAVEGERKLIFDEVVVRVDASFVTSMHIDTDEGNAACVGRDTFGTIIP